MRIKIVNRDSTFVSALIVQLMYLLLIFVTIWGLLSCLMEGRIGSAISVLLVGGFGITMGILPTKRFFRRYVRFIKV